jgi:hypothetical protein
MIRGNNLLSPSSANLSTEALTNQKTNHLYQLRIVAMEMFAAVATCDELVRKFNSKS